MVISLSVMSLFFKFSLVIAVRQDGVERRAFGLLLLQLFTLPGLDMKELVELINQV